MNDIFNDLSYKDNTQDFNVDINNGSAIDDQSNNLLTYFISFDIQYSFSLAFQSLISHLNNSTSHTNNLTTGIIFCHPIIAESIVPYFQVPINNLADSGILDRIEYIYVHSFNDILSELIKLIEVLPSNGMNEESSNLYETSQNSLKLSLKYIMISDYNLTNSNNSFHNNYQIIIKIRNAMDILNLYLNKTDIDNRMIFSWVSSTGLDNIFNFLNNNHNSFINDIQIQLHNSQHLTNNINLIETTLQYIIIQLNNQFEILTFPILKDIIYRIVYILPNNAIQFILEQIFSEQFNIISSINTILLNYTILANNFKSNNFVFVISSIKQLINDVSTDSKLYKEMYVLNNYIKKQTIKSYKFSLFVGLILSNEAKNDISHEEINNLNILNIQYNQEISLQLLMNLFI